MSSEIKKSDIKLFFSGLNINKSENDLDNIVKYCCDNGISKTYLYQSLSNDYIKSRFLDLNSQKDHGVHFPAQRSKEWFNQREKIKGTITGSRPSGWWFEMKSPETYQDQLDYLYGVKKKVFPPEAIKRMNYGTKNEDHAMFEFIRWTITQKRDMYVYECGFRRNKTYDNLGVPLGASPDGLISEYFYGIILSVGDDKTVCAYIDDEDECRLKTFLKDDPSFDLAVASANDYNTIEKCGWDKELLCQTLEKRAFNIHGVSKETNGYTGIMICENSILEIKCPTKLYGNIPIYYLAQLHLEAHTYNLRKVYFTCWHQKDGMQRLRVWKLKFHDGFFSSFLDLAECFHLKNDRTNQIGANAYVTLPMWKKFKLEYGRIGQWQDFIKPYHTRGKFALERSYKK
tara:strand:+ start:1582 stop:2781 length:1200 start_codon:yes stop_codon:yes gene_type:complete